MPCKSITAALLFSSTALAAWGADESSVSLKSGADADLTVARCTICHSVDYIAMNSGFLTGAGWDAEVHKMMKVMGAAITDEEAKRIVAYLTQYYGSE
jgi:hypothetical protein